MSDRFSFRRSWGAELLDGGKARFRLWAPGLDGLQLVYGGGDALPMERSGDGWFEVATDRIGQGEPYAFRLPDETIVPDPASRAQEGDVHGASLLIDPRAFRWRTGSWSGRPWEEAVIYELHTGTFSETGTFDGIADRLEHLAATGVTAIELMPVAQFGGNRGWGYDGVLHYAPHRAYGGPDGLKALVDAAHGRGLMVLLDVVYNHFGPDGNYLHLYAPEFFDEDRVTPWGAAIAYQKPQVRQFFVENALYWLDEYRFDGLRLDAINEIQDPSGESILDEIARTVRARFGDRHIHLTTEDDRNITRLHERDAAGKPILYTAEWNDDFHHTAHVAATGESEGYYADYVDGPAEKLARSLADGYVFQGEPSRFWDDTPRGAPCAHLPPTAFVNFIQNHDQIGNRAFNERLTDLAPARIVEVLTAILLLSPQIPLLFMGEEWGETRPFAFFTDFHGDLADAVREGRRREFRRFARFADESLREQIPDPNAESTFLASRIDWSRLAQPEGQARLTLIRALLATRRREIVPRLRGIGGNAAVEQIAVDDALGVCWHLADASLLTLIANLRDDPCAPPVTLRGRVLHESLPELGHAAAGGTLAGWSVLVLIEEAGGAPSA